MVAINLHRLWLMSKTTKRPTTSEFLQLFRTSAKFLQSACFVILYQAFRDASHSPCSAVASRMAFRLTTRMWNLRILRSQCQVFYPQEVSLYPAASPEGKVQLRGRSLLQVARTHLLLLLEMPVRHIHSTPSRRKRARRFRDAWTTRRISTPLGCG